MARKKKPKASAPKPLNAAQRAAAKADQNPLLNPGVQLSGASLKKAASQLAGLSVNPQIRAVDRTERQATRQGTALADRAGSYYAQLAKDALGQVSTQSAISQRLQASLAAGQANTQASMAASGQQEAKRAVADAQLRGAGLDGGGAAESAAELAAQQQRAAAQGQTASSTAALNSAGFEGLANIGAMATGARGGEIKGELLNRVANKQAELRAQRQELQASKGTERTKQLLGLRQSGFENLITAKTLGLKEADLTQSAAQAAADRKLKVDLAAADKAADNAKDASKVNKWGYTAAEWVKMPASQRESIIKGQASYGKTPKTPTAKDEPSVSLKLKDQIERGRSRFVYLEGKGWDEAKIKRDALKNGVPLAVYNAVYDLQRAGTLNPANGARLRQMGLWVPADWKRRKKKGAAINNSPGSDAAQG